MVLLRDESPEYFGPNEREAYYYPFKLSNAGKLARNLYTRITEFTNYTAASVEQNHVALTNSYSA